MKNTKKIISGLVTVSVLIFFYRSLSYYFVQDDFWLLKISNINSINQFIEFFIPRSDAVWYRPLSSQVFFFLNRLLFGLNPYPYHLFSLTTYMATVYFLYLLTEKIFQNRKIALWACIFYGLNQVNLLSISWLAAYSFILGPLLLILVLLNYDNHFLKAVIAGLLGILASEIFVVLPVILFFNHKFLNNKKYFKIIPFLLMSVSIIILRRFVFPATENTSLYNIELNISAVNTVRFYFLRITGLPLFFPLLPLYEKITIAVLSIIFFAIILWGINKNIKLIPADRIKILYFSMLSLILLAPFLFIPNHLSPHYLSYALVGFCPVLGYLLFLSLGNMNRAAKNRMQIILLIVFIAVNFMGIESMYKFHWLFSRAKLAETLVRTSHFNFPVGSEEYFALGAGTAADVFIK